jgi:hypothetical protein
VVRLAFVSGRGAAVDGEIKHPGASAAAQVPHAVSSGGQAACTQSTPWGLTSQIQRSQASVSPPLIHTDDLFQVPLTLARSRRARCLTSRLVHHGLKHRRDPLQMDSPQVRTGLWRVIVSVAFLHIWSYKLHVPSFQSACWALRVRWDETWVRFTEPRREALAPTIGSADWSMPRDRLRSIH